MDATHVSLLVIKHDLDCSSNSFAQKKNILLANLFYLSSFVKYNESSISHCIFKRKQDTGTDTRTSLYRKKEMNKCKSGCGLL